MNIKSNRGQGLVEYLILVCLMAVASIGVLRSVNHVINTKFIEIDYALRGVHKKMKRKRVDESLGVKRDLSNFMNGVGSREKK